jgi:hypothetical protein
MTILCGRLEGVFGPNDDGERSILWDEMAGLMSWWDMP